LRVISRRKGDDAAAAFLEREARQRVEGATELERARALQVLALEEDLRGCAFVDRSGCDDRRAMSDAGDLPGRELDVGKGRERRGAGERRDDLTVPLMAVPGGGAGSAR
jgi:hypothetical protein